MSTFINKKVLITGGSSGIGLLIGELALKKGAEELIIWDINKAASDREVDRLKGLGYRAVSYVVDVSDPEIVTKTSERLLSEGIVPDILVLNAGIVSGKYFHEHDKGEIESTLGVNVLGVMLTAKAFLPAMIQRRTGHIVTIASAAGMLANPKMAVYAASKWAALGWSDSLRLEMEQLKTGVKVTTVTPSYIDTGMFDGVRTNAVIPKVKPDDAAKAIIKGIEKNKLYVRMPFMVYTIPLVKGLLPARWFDLLVGKGLGVYKTMSTFTGRKSK